MCDYVPRDGTGRTAEAGQPGGRGAASHQGGVKGDTGADIEIELDTDSFKDDAVALNFFEHQGAKYLANAMRIISVDDMGKQAIAESIKKARFVNLPVEKAADKQASLSGGVLTVTGAWGVGSSDGWIGYDALARSITEQL